MGFKGSAVAAETGLTAAIGDSLHFVVGSDGLEDAKVCFSVDGRSQEETLSPYSDISCHVWIVIPE